MRESTIFPEKSAVTSLFSGALLCVFLTGCSAYAPPESNPILLPVSGTYHAPVTVTIGNQDHQATTHYTISGSSSGGEQIYSGSFTLNTSATIQAYATSAQQPNSQWVTAQYDIELPPPAPTFSPLPGSYAQPIFVTLADLDPQARIFYTTDGTTPSSSSTSYRIGSGISVSSNLTLEAIAYTADLSVASPVAIGVYTFTPNHHSWGCKFGCSLSAPAPPCNHPSVAGGLLQGATWTDAAGVLWLFGGRANLGAPAYTNALWSFSIATQGWTLVSPTSPLPTYTNSPGVYGTQGVAAATNIPGARYGAYSWTDATGLWLFGGQGADATGALGALNDLWRFDLTNQLWTWMGGSTHINATGVYGTQGAASAANTPGARYSGTAWTDSAGNAFLFGASGYDSAGTFGSLNDLWKFSIATGNWTWISGSSTVNALPSFGTESVPLPTNTPGAYSQGMTSSIDAKNNLIFIAGAGIPSNATAPQTLNTVWQYSPASGNWTWLNGSTTAGASGVYGAMGVTAPANTPGARENGIGFTDKQNVAWIFGGLGDDVNGISGYLNDLWTLDPVTHQWVWVTGSNTIGASGANLGQGYQSTTNTPGARAMGMSWVDKNGNFWIFSGIGYDDQGKLGYLSDQWLFVP